MTVEFSFLPVNDKMYNYKFLINIQDNAKPMGINLKGQGVQVQLEVKSEVVNIGPVLPYDPQAYALLEVHNPSEYDTELYSLNFDPQFKYEEAQLNNYPHFKDKEPLYFPVRKPAQRFWPQVILENQKNQQILNCQ